MTAHSRKQATHRRGATTVYRDLGYRAPETMLVKGQLVSKIAELVTEKGMTAAEAAALLDIPQPKLTKMLRGQFRGICLFKLMKCLTRLGLDARIIVQQRVDGRRRGVLSVTFE